MSRMNRSCSTCGTLGRSPASILDCDCRSTLRLSAMSTQTTISKCDQRLGIWMYLSLSSLRDKTCRRNIFKARQGLVYPAHLCLSSSTLFQSFVLIPCQFLHAAFPSAPQPLPKEPLAGFHSAPPGEAANHRSRPSTCVIFE
jgi:hypothetical protein